MPVSSSLPFQAITDRASTRIADGSGRGQALRHEVDGSSGFPRTRVGLETALFMLAIRELLVLS